jgi:hypothetical protein
VLIIPLSFRMMSSPALSSPVHPYRFFTFDVDGIHCSKAFDHPPATTGNLDHDLNRDFHAWLESRLPGYFAVGRVSRIAFTDRFRKTSHGDPPPESLPPWTPPPPSAINPPERAGSSPQANQSTQPSR